MGQCRRTWTVDIYMDLESLLLHFLSSTIDEMVKTIAKDLQDIRRQKYLSDDSRWRLRAPKEPQVCLMQMLDSLANTARLLHPSLCKLSHCLLASKG